MLVLGRYRTLEQIASGGSSAVYRGQDERLGRSVCVKIFHQKSDDPSVYQTTYDHFIREAFALSKLIHPNTLRIFDFGYLEASPTERPTPVQISELLSGGTLRELVRGRGPLSAHSTARVVAAIGGALEEAHEMAIVHRDVKPQNIVFERINNQHIPKLVDFGISKCTTDANDDSSAMRMYSVQWAAPEQLLGQPPDPASDVYSLALIAQYMLSGRHVFPARNSAAAFAERQRAQTLIGETLAGEVVPEAIDVIVRGCASNSDDRPGVAEFYRELTAALRGNSRPMRRFPLGSGPTPQLLSSDDERGQIGEREVRVVSMVDRTVELTCEGLDARLRLSVVAARSGVALHVKGLSCFVRAGDSNPSTGTLLAENVSIELLSAALEPLARATLVRPQCTDSLAVFNIQEQPIAINFEPREHVLGLDFGPNRELVIIRARM